MTMRESLDKVPLVEQNRPSESKPAARVADERQIDLHDFRPGYPYQIRGTHLIATLVSIENHEPDANLILAHKHYAYVYIHYLTHSMPAHLPITALVPITESHNE